VPTAASTTNESELPSPLWPAHSSAAAWTVYWDKPLRSMLTRLSPIEGARILVVGCGDGPLAASLVRRGAEVVAFDLSHPALANAAATDPGPLYLQADASNIPVKEAAFDFTLSISTLQYMPIGQVIKNCRRALRPGGVALFVENLAGNPSAKVDRLRRRVFRIREPPTMHIRRHLSLRDLATFETEFSHLTAHAWYDWSTILLPLLRVPLIARKVESVVRRTGLAPVS
jgi:SAM-dependent methyltransferase